MTSSLKRQIELLSRTAPGADKAHKRRAAIGSWAAMVGALILARLSDKSDFSDEILSETRAWLLARRTGSEKWKTQRESSIEVLAASL
jgi:TetR/AcrR family transcriptional repressor of nem operon